MPIYIAGTSTVITGGVNAATRFPPSHPVFLYIGHRFQHQCGGNPAPVVRLRTKITFEPLPTSPPSPGPIPSATAPPVRKPAVGVALDSSGRRFMFAGSTSATAFTLTNTQLGSALSPTGTENDITSTRQRGYVLALASGGKTATLYHFSQCSDQYPTVLQMGSLWTMQTKLMWSAPPTA